MSQRIEIRISAASSLISVAWRVDGSWTPAFKQALAAAARDALRDLHGVDAEEVSYQLGLLLLEFGAITPAQLPRIGVFLS
jgi:hypothetical protein